MKAHAQARDEFIAYPTHRVVGTISDAKEARAAVEDLLRAGFAREDIDILHGEKDLHRLDPTGEEHGFLAQFQRTLIRTAAAAEEFTRLMHHVDDVRAGRFVIMVLAKEREKRNLSADILNSHGAEFVEFFGRWAWQSMETGQADDARAAASEAGSGGTYEVDLDGTRTRVRFESAFSASVVPANDLASTPLVATVTPIRPGLSMLSWQDADRTIVQVEDFERGTAYASVTERDGTLRHRKGTIRSLD